MIFLKLFYIFFKTGLFTIGGGLATIPLLHDEIVDNGLISNAEFYDMLAVSQSTPGPIGINLATYVGYNLGSIPGAIIATFAMVTPSIIIIYLIARFIGNFNGNTIVRRAMCGFRPTAIGLIATAAYYVLINAILPSGKLTLAAPQPEQIISGLIIIITALIFKRYNPHPIYCLAGAAIAGIIFL